MSMLESHICNASGHKYLQEHHYGYHSVPEKVLF